MAENNVAPYEEKLIEFINGANNIIHQPTRAYIFTQLKAKCTQIIDDHSDLSIK